MTHTIAARDYLIQDAAGPLDAVARAIGEAPGTLSPCVTAAALILAAEQPAVTQVAPADAEHAAQLALAASVAAGNPISQRQMMTRFGLTRTAERKVRQAVLAGSNGHVQDAA